MCKFTKKQATDPTKHDPVDLHRPLVWIDDQDLDEDIGGILHTAQCLLVQPTYFLNYEGMKKVDEFLGL